YPADHPWSQPPSGPVDPRNLDGLDERFRPKVVRILQRLQQKGWQPRVASGRRTLAQQREKVRKGYSKTLRSWHLLGRAADIVDRRWGWNGPAANLDHPFWKDLGEAARLEGLTWGGNWKRFRDVAHVQDDDRRR
ncbi:MAG: M15 family peptidase, partial [Planctomycetota bacterium]